ncbi:hypothetical protein [uncultured Dialister sp.]|uniref:hypothetical protein n=1 Tax=uncultured Dialister sp. TaxID=278064 RepID=UPI00205297D3|nr:hypothetical protein [uncultured Dialister sp.]DAE67663.1 MAG TPA: replisome organizer protein [Caudoviricetes sp.]
MAEGNWIKLYRKMIDDPAFVNSTPAQVKVLLTVMFLAAWTPKKWDVLGHEFTIQPGEAFISTRDLADRAGDGVSHKVVRGALERFEKLGFWTLKRARTGTLIHIVNWRRYQLYEGVEGTGEGTGRAHEGHSEGTGRAHEGHSEGTGRAHEGHSNKKEGKNVRREEYNTPLPPKGGKGGVVSLFEKVSGDNQELLSALKEWQEMRKRMKKPLTEKAAELNLKDLQKLSGGDEQQMVAIVLQSIKRGWQGFYTLKEAQAPRAAPQNSQNMEDFIDGLEQFKNSLPTDNSHWDA